jgi:hypothetical protein
VSLNSIEVKSIRRFGIIAFVFFGILGALGFWSERSIPSILFGFLCVLGLGFILVPGPLQPLYYAWLKIGHFLGRVMTTMMLSLAYFFIITPAGLLKRVFGGRPLPLEPDKESPSYWVPREEPAQPRERFLKLF